MRAPVVTTKVLRDPVELRPEPKSEPKPELGDLRFRALMTEEEWFSLPLAIRRRFSKRLAGGQTIVYAGEILESWTSRGGWGLAQAARFIGGAVALDRGGPGRKARGPPPPGAKRGAGDGGTARGRPGLGRPL